MEVNPNDIEDTEPEEEPEGEDLNSEDDFDDDDEEEERVKKKPRHQFIIEEADEDGDDDAEDDEGLDWEEGAKDLINNSRHEEPSAHEIEANRRLQHMFDTS